MSNSVVIDAPEVVLVRGQSVRVPIVLQVERTLKIRGITARFHGAEETKATYTTTSSNGKGGTTTTTHTAVELMNIVEQSYLLAGSERKGCLFNVGDALATLFGGGQHEVLEPGRYEYEVMIAVPSGAPPTHQGDRSRVFYELSVRVDVPLARDLQETCSFEVFPAVTAEPTAEPVRVRFPDDEGRGFWDRMLEPNVSVELALGADRVYVGETIEGMLLIETPEPLLLKRVAIRLTAKESSKAHGHTDSHAYKGSQITLAAPGTVDDRYAERFSLVVQPDGPVSANGKLFAIEWFVEAELDVPWAKDPRIRAPVHLSRRGPDVKKAPQP